MPAESEKTCFIVGPIGADDSDDRVHADWLLEEIIQPVFTESYNNYKVIRADKIAEPGRIDAQIISYLLDSDLVIADLTTQNANAFYEIGIRHMAQKPIVHMHLDGERIPFDVAAFRSVKFSRRKPRDLKAARLALQAAVQAALGPGHSVDNPVTVARGRIEIQKSASPAETILFSEMESMRTRLSMVENLISDRNGVSVKSQGKVILLRPKKYLGEEDFDIRVENFMKGTKLIASGIVERDVATFTVDNFSLSYEEIKNMHNNADMLGLYLDIT